MMSAAPREPGTGKRESVGGCAYGPSPVHLGARTCAQGVEFGVWAPVVTRLAVRSQDQSADLERLDRGVWHGVLPGLQAGADYVFVLDDEHERPDPRSLWQPEGPHGPSRVLGPQPAASPFSPPQLRDVVLYEMHCGTFTPGGTFDTAIERLDYLHALGVTAVEVMPVAGYAGRHGWGYDGVNLDAVHEPYGGPLAFRRFIDACHKRGLAVVLDVVYNHLGPDGNYLAEFGPYFTDRYQTPWGSALNYDGPGSDFVRSHVIDNAVRWVRDFGVDGLRLDAVHGIIDTSSVHLLEEIASSVHAAKPGALVIAESDRHDPGIVTTFGLDAQWADDLHHALHVRLTGERHGYYQGFDAPGMLERALTDGWSYTGQYDPVRDRRHGRSTAGLGGERFVVSAQNHDQVGNRAAGDRLAALVGPKAAAIAAVVVCCAPFVPLLFQGEEWGETQPFLYFTDFDSELGAAVARGRRQEFAAFGWGDQVPDPNDEETFTRSVLDWSRARGPMLTLYRSLLALRRQVPALRDCRRDLVRVRGDAQDDVLVMTRDHPVGGTAVVVANFGSQPRPLPREVDGLVERVVTEPVTAGVLAPLSAGVWTAEQPGADESEGG